MSDIIEVENLVDGQGMRQVHLMANRALTAMDLRAYLPPADVVIDVTQEAGACHLRAAWPYCGVLDFQPGGWPKARRLVVWSLEQAGRVSVAVQLAAGEFERVFGRQPGLAFVRRLPAGVDDCQDVDGLMLLEAEWMPERCVAVGGRKDG